MLWRLTSERIFEVRVCHTVRTCDRTFRPLFGGNGVSARGPSSWRANTAGCCSCDGCQYSVTRKLLNSFHCKAGCTEIRGAKRRCNRHGGPQRFGIDIGLQPWLLLLRRSLRVRNGRLLSNCLVDSRWIFAWSTSLGQAHISNLGRSYWTRRLRSRPASQSLIPQIP